VMHILKIKESMTTIMGLENNDSVNYKLIPNYSLGEFVFDTKIHKYLKDKKFEIISNEDPLIGNMYGFSNPKITAFIDDRDIIESIKCSYKCYVYGTNILNLNIDFVVKEIIKKEPDSMDSFLTYYQGKEVKERVYDFDTLGIQIWTYRNKVVTVICSNLDDTMGPSSSAY
jgi:hypothetical protein